MPKSAANRRRFREANPLEAPKKPPVKRAAKKRKKD